MRKSTIQLMSKAILMVLFIFSVQNIYAQQQPRSASDMAQKEVDRLKKELSLSEEQEGKVKTIVLKYEEKKQEVRKEKSDFSTTKTKIDALEKQKEEELKGVLTTEQFEKLQATKQQMKDKGPRKKK